MSPKKAQSAASPPGRPHPKNLGPIHTAVWSKYAAFAGSYLPDMWPLAMFGLPHPLPRFPAFLSAVSELLGGITFSPGQPL